MLICLPIIGIICLGQIHYPDNCTFSVSSFKYAFTIFDIF